MGVYIKGMERPEKCLVCPIQCMGFCEVTGTEVVSSGWSRRADYCPIVEEPEPCVDAVSRQAATAECFQSMIILSSEFGNELPDGEKRFNDGLRKAIEKIRELPPVTPKTGPQWTPCSERLPTDCLEKIVTFQSGYVGTASFVLREKIYCAGTLVSTRENFWQVSEEDEEEGEVVAWREKPEPFQEEGNK